MKPLVKNILSSVTAVALTSYLLIAPCRMDHTPEQNTCHAVHITVLDSAQRQYILVDEVAALIRQQGLWPAGKTLDKVSLQTIEDCVQSHPMVRRADCYRLNDQSIYIQLSQRVPLLQVRTAAETYFVDTDHRVLPYSPRIKDEVITVTGAVSEQTACEQLASVAEWLDGQRFWRQKITRIHLPVPGRMIFYEKDKTTRIEAGGYTDYARNMKKLYTFYRAGLEETPYNEIDLRYRGQVIGRK